MNPTLRAILALLLLGCHTATPPLATNVPVITRTTTYCSRTNCHHITGTATPYDFLRASTALNTRRISRRVTADVLLLAGADDHYVPLKQLGRQAGHLVNARSVTTRTFTAAEQASNHCQVGNIGAAVRVIQGWLAVTAISRTAEKGDVTEELASLPVSHD